MSSHNHLTCALTDRCPREMGVLTTASDKVYQYLTFDKIEEFTDAEEKVPAPV